MLNKFTPQIALEYIRHRFAWIAQGIERDFAMSMQQVIEIASRPDNNEALIKDAQTVQIPEPSTTDADQLLAEARCKVLRLAAVGAVGAMTNAINLQETSDSYNFAAQIVDPAMQLAATIAKAAAKEIYAVPFYWSEDGVVAGIEATAVLSAVFALIHCQEMLEAPDDQLITEIKFLVSRYDSKGFDLPNAIFMNFDWFRQYKSVQNTVVQSLGAALLDLRQENPNLEQIASDFLAGGGAAKVFRPGERLVVLSMLTMDDCLLPFGDLAKKVGGSVTPEPTINMNNVGLYPTVKIPGNVFTTDPIGVSAFDSWHDCTADGKLGDKHMRNIYVVSAATPGTQQNIVLLRDSTAESIKIPVTVQ